MTSIISSRALCPPRTSTGFRITHQASMRLGMHLDARYHGKGSTYICIHHAHTFTMCMWVYGIWIHPNAHTHILCMCMVYVYVCIHHAHIYTYMHTYILCACVCIMRYTYTHCVCVCVCVCRCRISRHWYLLTSSLFDPLMASQRIPEAVYFVTSSPIAYHAILLLYLWITPYCRHRGRLRVPCQLLTNTTLSFYEIKIFHVSGPLRKIYCNSTAITFVRSPLLLPSRSPPHCLNSPMTSMSWVHFQWANLYSTTS